MKYLLLSIIIFINILKLTESHNKYSAEANQPDAAKALKNLENPFRMQKVNLLWNKARVRLSDPKLKSLYTSLKVHDKEELTLKHVRSEGGDKDGMKEAELRKKFISIMSQYGLLDYLDEAAKNERGKASKYVNDDKAINKSLFKDKKLNKLWSKIETAGFSTLELDVLKEEFEHHQDKIDQYYTLLSDVKEKNGKKDDSHENSVDDLDRFNTLELGEEPPKKDYLDKTNLVRDKHTELKQGYDRLQLLAYKGPNSKEFIEPKVQELWKVALEANFTPYELESLRVELLHYENRLLKLRHMQAEAALNADHRAEKIKIHGEKTDGMIMMEENIKKQGRKVEKIHLDLETKIMQKRIEL
ncbi:alpha-2-macroglobulin receptor-associated protein [Onthophagus taurus]|uniref:alpha-2-macroglobulin receptor-associated protein n=1 Tax=Onthophagus taurus TaxID=166361 RepID=UPI000C20AF30|nr:alpha-2-macroglobulin receptor-associated protein [Onthophagus taurus]